ncbi:MAG: hypothetical protein AAB257_06055 [Nitrospinota bacterium]
MQKDETPKGNSAGVICHCEAKAKQSKKGEGNETVAFFSYLFLSFVRGGWEG